MVYLEEGTVWLCPPIDWFKPPFKQNKLEKKIFTQVYFLVAKQFCNLDSFIHIEYQSRKTIIPASTSGTRQNSAIPSVVCKFCFVNKFNFVYHLFIVIWLILPGKQLQWLLLYTYYAKPSLKSVHYKIGPSSFNSLRIYFRVIVHTTFDFNDK